jgi:hypothetical protein
LPLGIVVVCVYVRVETGFTMAYQSGRRKRTVNGGVQEETGCESIVYAYLGLKPVLEKRSTKRWNGGMLCYIV